MKKLTQLKCVACEGIGKPLERDVVSHYLLQVPKWGLADKNKIKRIIKCKDFKKAMKIVNDVAIIAEEEGHHPDIRIFSWNNLEFILYTHAIDGLSVNDFILAAKIDKILSKK